MENQTLEPLELGFQLYQNKAPYGEILAHFETLAGDRAHGSTAHTCLSWVHLMRREAGDVDKAVQHAKQALGLERNNAQAQYNLVLAMLTGKVKGVREAFEKALHMSSHDDLHAAVDNLKEGIERHPDYPEARKLLQWIEDAHACH